MSFALYDYWQIASRRRYVTTAMRAERRLEARRNVVIQQEDHRLEMPAQNRRPLLYRQLARTDQTEVRAACNLAQYLPKRRREDNAVVG
ncbi:hypothetical protein [Paraburkholderia sp. RL17-337-BIB-A]|uniref:hypothetical protein n=1 Tax=Paraburkholderia sp. RL17-337-BIB-A TaxID=3031636 RepID=UPI0038BCA7B4